MYAQVGDDPFTVLESEKRERVKANKKRQVDNVKTMAKAGHALPPTLKLASVLPEHGSGRGQKRKQLQTEVGQMGHMPWSMNVLLGARLLGRCI